MLLTATAKNSDRVSQLRKLTELTHQGQYINIVDPLKAHSLGKRFFQSMDVYPSKKVTNMREYFVI